ncbi:Deoxyhypusine synthase, partial [Ceratobasidium sp. UAMH 11750]
MSSVPPPGSSALPAAAAAAVLVQSQPVPDDAIPVRGPDFDKPLDLNTLLGGYEQIGFQATSLGRAIRIVNKMRNWRLSDEPLTEDESPDYTDPQVRAATRCT